MESFEEMEEIEQLDSDSSEDSEVLEASEQLYFNKIEIEFETKPIRLQEQQPISVIIKLSLRSATFLSLARLIGALGELGNNIFRSRLGVNELAASALIQSTEIPLLLLSLAPLLATNVVIKEAKVENRNEEVGEIFQQTIIMSVFSHLPVLPVYLTIEPLLIAFGQSPNLALLVKQYYEGFLVGYPVQIFLLSCNSLFIGLEKHGTVPLIALTGTVIGVGTAYPLIYPVGNSSGLGFRGSGYALVVNLATKVIVSILILVLSKKYKPYHLFNFKKLLSVFAKWQKRLWKEGAPIVLAMTTELATTFSEGAFAGLLGTNSLGAINISIQYNAINDIINAGLFSSISNFVRGHVALGNYDSARRYGNTGIIIGVSFSVVLGIIAVSIPRQIVSIFVDTSQSANEPLVQEMITVLNYTVPMTIVESVKKSTISALFGYEDRIFPVLLNLASSWLIGLPLMYALSAHTGLRSSGLVISLLIAYSITSTLLVLRWHKVTRNPEKFISNRKQNKKASKEHDDASSAQNPSGLWHHKQKRLTKIIKRSNYWEIDVPGDNSCLFWSALLAYLLPIIKDKSEFGRRFILMFGKENLNYINDVHTLLEKYNPLDHNIDIFDNEMLIGLIHKVFRSKLINYMATNKWRFLEFHVDEHQTFSHYLERMEEPSSWGGELEIRAISLMLVCSIKVFGAEVTEYQHNDENSDIQLILIHTNFSNKNVDNRNHYRFGLDDEIISQYESPSEQISLQPNTESQQIAYVL